VISLYTPKDAYDANFLNNLRRINLARQTSFVFSASRKSNRVRRHRLRHARLDKPEATSQSSD
jgi:hypothetical protein